VPLPTIRLSLGYFAESGTETKRNGKPTEITVTDLKSRPLPDNCSARADSRLPSAELPTDRNCHRSNQPLAREPGTSLGTAELQHLRNCANPDPQPEQEARSLAPRHAQCSARSQEARPCDPVRLQWHVLVPSMPSHGQEGLPHCSVPDLRQPELSHPPYRYPVRACPAWRCRHRATARRQ